ncbi:WXG100 family type VII secretion target [Plantactinospora sp. WMMB782]|uniref:WXG100 family type VII secretion target n=1 Tax=Plantactinospora sp. WMMB782 TaxID=3404121 RepID=UPI003B95E071
MTLALPEAAYVLSGVARLVGVDDPVAMLKEFQQFVDTDELRRAATEVWGISPTSSPTSAALNNHAERLVDEFLRTVEDRWQGTASEAYERYLGEVRAALHQEADSIPIVGGALVMVADGIELTWLEMVGAVLTAVGLVLSVASLVGAGNIVVSLLGLIGGLASGVITYLSMARPRVELLAKHESTLDGKGRHSTSPVDALPSIDGRSAGWTPKTADPNT